MSAEGPVRKPTSDPPDVDSLMSRLDGSADDDRTSDPGSERRPSAAELLGSARDRAARRAKRGIRVPDDAIPGAPPSSRQDGARRSAPPPPMSPTSSTPSSAPQQQFGRSVTSSPIISIGGTSPSHVISSSNPPHAPSHAVPPAPMPPAQMPPAQMPPAPVPQATGSSPISEPMRLRTGPNPVYVPTSDVRLAAAPVAAPVITDSRSAPSPADAARAAAAPIANPNLDAQVREALALLDREDFEGGIDIAVSDEETPAAEGGPASTEESLDGEELEVVEKDLSPSRRAVSAPPAPPRKGSKVDVPPMPGVGVISQPTLQAAPPLAQAQPTSAPPVGHTLPSAPPQSREHDSQPSIVVAAAASAASGAPQQGAAISSVAAPAVNPLSTTGENAAADMRKKKRQWFEELFNDDYARACPKVDGRFLDREVSFIEDALGCDKGATILDLACGPGEHAVALAGRGYEVIGIDLSLSMLARAADEASEKNQRINFLQGDMRDLTFDEAFDGIYCWGTSFGYFDDAKNAEVVQKIHRALRRGGRFLLDVVNRDYIAPRAPSMVWFEGDGCVCMDEANLNGINSRLVVKRTMMMEDGRHREIDYSIRLYALHELGKLLHECGFRVAEASGDTSTPGTYFGAESPRILILAEKR